MELYKKFALYKSNGDYRMGDVIYHKGGTHGRLNSNNNVLLKPEYKGSVLERYISKCPDYNRKSKIKPEHRFEILDEIIKDKIDNEGFATPSGKQLVIHLRLGDVVLVKTRARKFLSKNYKKLISDKLKQFPEINEIVLCGAFNYSGSKRYTYSDKAHIMNINNIKKIIKIIQVEFPQLYLTVQSSENVDKDFIYMCSAKHFIPDHGGFTEIIVEYRQLKYSQSR